jgi:formylglycine-generating enzyme required for sulfatase activity
MKPITSVFVSPVRPSRMIQGLSGRGSGAHEPCLPAAQEEQTQSLQRRTGGSLRSFRGCRRFYAKLTALLIFCMSTSQTVAEVGKTETALSGKASSTITATAQIHEKGNDTASISITTSSRPEITSQLAESCRQTGSREQAPAMVVIRPGHFQMGASVTDTESDPDENPQHSVTIPQPFAISRCEITVSQFKQFIKDTGYQTTAEKADSDGKIKGCNILNAETKTGEWKSDRNWNNPGIDQNDQHPVVCVSWQDAQHYVNWLSQRTGALYRLPTEAEWEYAARANTQSPRYYPADTQCIYANGADQKAINIIPQDDTIASCEDGYVYTAPVASFTENAFGLFDMLGNVYEWTLDCYHDNYRNAPYDSSAWLEADHDNCGQRVIRGGSWRSNPMNLRSAYRDRDYSDVASINLGFRIVRTL